MRLGFIVTGGLHPSGREEIMPTVLALLGQLARRHEVHAFVLRHLPRATTYAINGFTVHDLGRPWAKGGLGRWMQWRALAAAVRRVGQFDVFHGYWVDPGGFLAAVAGRRFGVPSIVTCDSGEFSRVDDIDYGLQRTARRRALVQTACRLTTRVHVTTEYMKRLASNHGHDAITIPFGTDLRRFQPPQRRAEGPPWRLLQVASLNRVKDQKTLIDAVAAIRGEIDVRLDLVGEDTLNGALQSYVARLAVADRVTFHGFRTLDQLPAFFQSAHLYVQSSRHEAAGAAVLEAAATALPVVGTCVGYVSDWQPLGAVATPPGDSSALGRAIVNTLTDSDRRRHIAAHALRFATEHDVEWTAAALESLYAELRP